MRRRFHLQNTSQIHNTAKKIFGRKRTLPTALQIRFINITIIMRFKQNRAYVVIAKLLFQHNTTRGTSAKYYNMIIIIITIPNGVRAERGE